MRLQSEVHSLPSRRGVLSAEWVEIAAEWSLCCGMLSEAWQSPHCDFPSSCTWRTHLWRSKAKLSGRNAGGQWAHKSRQVGDSYFSTPSDCKGLTLHKTWLGGCDMRGTTADQLSWLITIVWISDSDDKFLSPLLNCRLRPHPEINSLNVW